MLKGSITLLGFLPFPDSELIVTQRLNLLRVRDLDGDGKADDYDAITDDFGMSETYHEFNFTPVRDKQGNYFFALGTGSRGDGVLHHHSGQFNERGDRAGCIPPPPTAVAL